MRGLKLWPIVVGALIDLGGSFGASIVTNIAKVAVQTARGVEAAEGPGSALELALTLIVGLLFTATGGFVGAQMARTKHLRYGVAVGVASLCAGLLILSVGGPAGLPAWYYASGFIAVVPAGALGGYLAARSDKRR